MKPNYIFVVFLYVLFLFTLVTIKAQTNIKCGTFEEENYITKGGLCDRPNYNSQEYFYDTENFKIHYVLEGWHQTTVQYVESVAQYAETAWDIECIIENWPTPCPDGTCGGDSKYDIYIYNVPFYGITEPEGDGCGYCSNTSWIAVDVDLTDNELKSTIAHEFCHAVQFCYIESFNEDDLWFSENTATWMEEVVFDESNDWINFLSGANIHSPLTYPHLAINTTSADGHPNYQYGGALFCHLLSEWFDENLIIRRIWEYTSSTSTPFISSIDFILNSYYSRTLNDALERYSEWRFFTGNRDDGNHYSEAGLYPDVEILRIHNTLPANGTSSPDNLGSPGGTSYVIFDVNSDGIRIDFNGTGSSSDYKWFTNLIEFYENSTNRINKYTLDSNNDGSKGIPLLDIDEVILAATVNKNNQSFSNISYNYSAVLTATISMSFWNETLNGGVNLNGNLLIQNYYLIQSGQNQNLLENLEYFEKTMIERTQYLGQTYKHINWDQDQTDFYLNSSFISTSNGSERAKLNPLNYAKIEARLEGFLIDQKGEFQFQDPWFIKSDGSQPGVYWRPCVSYYEPTGNENANEKGVFLEQDYSIPGNPYYSVSTASPQDINFGEQLGTRRFYFQNWSGTNVRYESSNALETGIVFTNTNATAKANFKGQLMSNDQNGISSGSQRKLVRTDNGIYHIVYESMGSIFYTHSLTSNFNGQWRQEISLDSGIGIMSKNPAMDFEVNNLKIVFETDLDDVAAIYLLTLTPDGYGNYYIESTEEVLSYSLSYFGSAKPVIAYTDVVVFVAYRKNSSDGLYQKSKILIGGNWQQKDEELIPNTSLYSFDPSVAGFSDDIHLVYQHSLGVRYILAVFDNYGADYIYYAIVSTGSGYTNNYSPSISLAKNTYPVVSWIGYNYTDPGGGGINKIEGEAPTSKIVVRRASGSN